MTADPFHAIVARLFPVATFRATRLTGGVSADVHRLDVTQADGTMARVVVRVHGAAHAGHDADLEHRLLGALHRGGMAVPQPLLVDASGTLLPEPFLVLEFVDGASDVPADQTDRAIDLMAATLAGIHGFDTAQLPPLPARLDPLPEVFDFLPDGVEWHPLEARLRALTDTAYRGTPALLHGDFWPQNLLWRDGAIAAILDWEDAALGDPLSDVACTRLELRYLYGTAGMQRFSAAYARHRPLDPKRLALWQIYVAAAAQRFMGRWGLEPAREGHMRAEALASLREAATELFGRLA